MMKQLRELQQENLNCNRCPRLRDYCQRVGETKVKRFHEWQYWARPLAGFGDPKARLYVLGLAPAAHGGNRTGRMFTGDDSGNWLYRALYEVGFANQPTSVSADDGLTLTGAYIANAVRCAPPDNKPTPAELAACRPFLEQELALLSDVKVVLALGRIAFDAYLKVRAYGSPKPKFAHGAEYRAPGLPVLLCSYHPSRQNTNTGRLTETMWAEIFKRARALTEGSV